MPGPVSLQLFDFTNKATILKWGRKIMVTVLDDSNKKTVTVQYGTDPDTGRPVIMKVHRIKNSFRRLSESEAQVITSAALSVIKSTDSSL